MPMIDVYAPADLFPAGTDRTIAEELTGALLRAEGVTAPSPLHLDNTAAYLHRLPTTAVHTARTGSARTVRVQVLTPPGALNRAAVGREVIDFVKETGKATNTGQAIMALAIEAFMPPAEFKKTVDGLIRDIRQSRRLPHVERIWLPGEQSHGNRLDRRAHGIPMSKALRENLDGVARELKIAPLE